MCLGNWTAEQLNAVALILSRPTMGMLTTRNDKYSRYDKRTHNQYSVRQVALGKLAADSLRACHVERLVSWNDNAFNEDLVMRTHSQHSRHSGKRTTLMVSSWWRLWHLKCPRIITKSVTNTDMPEWPSPW